MKKTIITSLIGLMFACIPALAEGTFKLKLNDNISVRPGKIVDVDVILENDNQVDAILLEMNLPEGLTPVSTMSGGQEIYSISLNESRCQNHSADALFNAAKNNRYRIIITPNGTSNKIIKGNSGTIATLHLKASESLKSGKIILPSGKSYGMFENIDKYMSEGSESKVTVINSYAEYSISASDVTVKAGATAEMDILLTNPESVNGFFTNLYLPSGIKLVGCVGTDRLNGHEVTWHYNSENGSANILIDSPSIVPIKGNSGSIVKLTLEADATVESGTAYILTKGTYVNDMSDNEVEVASNKFAVKTIGSADYSLYINDFTIKAGQEQKVELNLDNVNDVNGLYAKFTLPAGIKATNVELSNARCSNHNVEWKMNADNVLSILIDSKVFGVGTIQGNTGVVATISLKSDASLAAGSYEVKMNGAYVNSYDEEYDIADQTFSFKAIASSSYKLNASDVNIKASKTAEMDIELINADEVNGFYAEYTLPAGILATNVKLNADRCKDHQVTWYCNDNVLRIMADSKGTTSIMSFKGNEGVIATVTLKAESSVAEGSYQIIMQNAYVNDADNDDIDVDDVTINLTVAAKPEYRVVSNSFGIKSGESSDFEIDLINEDDINGFFAIFKFPEHIKPKLDSDGKIMIELTDRASATHNLTCNYVEASNSLRVLIDSKDNHIANINGNSGTLLVITLSADNGLDDMTEYIQMTDAYVCDYDNEEPTIADDQFLVNIATGINEVENAAENAVIYNLSGQHVNSAAHGIFIMNGKKTVVK